MDYYERKLNNSAGQLRACWYSFLALVILSILCAFLSGCETIKYMPVETVRTEYLHSTDTVKETDTLFRDKETIIREADSATIAKLGLQLKQNERAILILQKELEKQISNKSESKTDTVFKTKDVQVPYPVEKPLTRWQQVCIDYGKLTMGATALLVVFIIVWLVRRFRKTL